MKYKMLVLDMDDTLLNDNHQISERNKLFISQAQAAGVWVVLASGRPTPAMQSYARELNLHQYGSYMLSYNGAVISEVNTGKIFFEQSMSKEDIHALYDLSVEHKLHIITYIDGQIIAETDFKYIDFESQLTGMPLKKVPSFKEAVYTSSVKCIFLEEPERLQAVAPLLQSQIQGKNVTTSKPFFLEVTEFGIDKAASLERLAKHLGIQQTEIIAVGNANNDLSMIEYAGLGVWVDNVTPELRDRADVIVASNNNDGVAEVIERFIL